MSRVDQQMNRNSRAILGVDLRELVTRKLELFIEEFSEQKEPGIAVALTNVLFRLAEILTENPR